MTAVRTVRSLPPGALRVGYSGTPENQEKKRLELEWGKKVENVDYRGTEYWIPLEKGKKPEKQPEKKPEEGKPKHN
jgi:hypothetical protein